MAKKSSKLSKSQGRKIKDSIGLGIALILLGIIFVFGGGNLLKRSNSDTFASEPVKIQGFVADVDSLEKIPQRIIIPELTIDLKVKNSGLINGYWQVFSDSAGWGEGSGIPGEAGNQVIFAHARRGLFLPLKDIKTGAKIYVLAKANWYEYEVKEIKEVRPTQVEVIAPTEDETLTLYTCSGFADSRRLIVIAKRTS
jgi:sortase A